MKVTRIMFPDREECQTEVIEMNLESVGDSEIVYRTHYSIISAGTELSGYTGKTSTPGAIPHYPVIAGNSLVGEVLAAGGQVILLGSPRGKANIDATEILQRVHIASYNVTLRGAHEWIYPVHAADDPNGFTMERGAQFILNWIRNGKLKVEHLITDVYHPCDAKQAYDGLLHRPDEHLGVLFDWSKVS